MFNLTKRILAVFAAITLPALAALWTAVLSRFPPTQHPYLPYIYVGMIAITSGGVAFFTHIKPAQDLEKPIIKFFGILAEAPLKLAKRHGIRPRLNLMLITRPWHLFGARRVKVVWGVGMDNFPDVRFSCSLSQGVVGEALRSQKPVMLNCETADPVQFNFSQKQLAQTKHVTAIWSLPIYEVDGKGQQTGRVIGALSLDSVAPGGFEKIKQYSAALEQDLRQLCEIISMVL
jgi:hypothetical protein